MAALLSSEALSLYIADINRWYLQSSPLETYSRITWSDVVTKDSWTTVEEKKTNSWEISRDKAGNLITKIEGI